MVVILISVLAQNNMSSKCFITFLNTTAQTERSDSNPRLQPRCLCSSHASLLRRKVASFWLLQQAPIGSVEGCPDQRFPRRFASFSPTLPPRRPARSIWRLVAGQMGLFAFDAGTKDATNW